MFVENAGQFSNGARFKVLGGDKTVWLADDAIWITLLEPTETQREPDYLALPDDQAPPPPIGDPTGLPHQGVHLRLSFPGANPRPQLQPFGPLSTTVSYFIGDDPAQWATAVPVWGGVRYVDLYPGLDLELGSDGPAVALRLVCRAGDCQESLDRVQFRVDGARSVTRLANGLDIETAIGPFYLPWFRVVNSAGRPLKPAGIDMPQVALLSGQLDHPLLQNLAYLPLVSLANPLLYGTYLGGSNSGLYESGSAIAVDNGGQAYVTGLTLSTDFPTTPGVFDPSHNGYYDAFVSKLNAAGSDLLYSTFLGGTGGDSGSAIFVDGAGQVYLTGYTESTNFPATPGAFDTTFNGGWGDVFIAKLNAAGSELLYATYLGGSGLYYDWGSAIAVDALGQAYVTGHTPSDDFPTTPGAFDTTFEGTDAFVVKLNAAGSELVYSTFLGGGATDEGYDIALDSGGQVFVAGDTYSADFPTTAGAFDQSHNGNADLFVVKLNTAGNGLLYSTFLGGTSYEFGFALVIDETGSAFVTGGTESSDFPTTAGSFDQSHNGGEDAFVCRLNLTGTDLLFSTFLGSSEDDRGYGMAINGAGQVFVAGSTPSADFPVVVGAFDPTFNGGPMDAFLAGLDAAGSDLLYSTFLGGSGIDGGRAISLAGASLIYLIGTTDSTNFPTTPGAFDTTPSGDRDAYVIKLETD